MDETHLPKGLAKRVGAAAALVAPVVAAAAVIEKRGHATPSLDPSRALKQQPQSVDREERARIAHLYRRAGFGASRVELDAAVARGYDATLDLLLQPKDDQDAADPIVSKIPVQQRRLDEAQRWWLMRMRHTSRPLVEKMTLFWHGHFTTAISKVSNGNLPLMRALTDQFRKQALGNFRDLLLTVSKDSTMSIWLDGRFNHKDEPNENYARELMELFTMGIGNYSEDDVKQAARAFTGWTFGGNDHRFVFNTRDHDGGQKTFLGQTGNFNGEDILNILVAEPATATYLSTRLAHFFLSETPDAGLIEEMAKAYLDSKYEIRPMLRVLFKSDAFSHPSARHALIKSPAEYIAGTLRTLDVHTEGTELPGLMAAMGQELFNPPNVAGWPGGPVWIATSTMIARANMANSIAIATGPDSGWYVDWQHAFGLPEQPTAAALVDAVLDHLVDGDVAAAQRDRLLKYLGGKPTDRLDLDRDELKLRGLVYLTLTLPVYQLN